MNFQTLVSASADPEAVRLLHLLGDWTHPLDVSALLPEYRPKSVLKGIQELLSKGLLVEERSEEAKRDAHLASVWSSWLPHGSFHFATKDVDFSWSTWQAHRYRQDLTKSSQPSFLKSYRNVPRIKLATEQLADGEFARVLMSRRTHREFSRGYLPLSAVSKLLYYTWGVTGKLNTPLFGRLFQKTSPSGGARHPGEVYLLAMRVRGLSQGLYHYDCLHHRLERLKAVPAINKAVEYAAGQKFLRDASALFLMTAVFPRVMWKYRFPRAYRVVLLDAGHLCQTFCLVATWLGMAPFCTAALNDSLIEQDLDLDGIRESILYVAGVGTG